MLRRTTTLGVATLLAVIAGCSSEDSGTTSEEPTATIPIADSNAPDTSARAAGDATHRDGTTITVSLDAIEGLDGQVVSAWVLPLELNEDKVAIGGTSFESITDDPYSDSKKIQPQNEDSFFEVLADEPAIVEPGTYRFIIEAYVPSGPMHYGCEMPVVVDGDEPLVLTLSSLPTYTGDGWHWTPPDQLAYPDCPDSEASTSDVATTGAATAVPDNTESATSEPQRDPVGVFSFADHDLCEWLSSDKIAELVKAEYEWDGTATEGAFTGLKDGCGWELSGTPDVDGLNTVSIGSATAVPDEPFLDYDDIEGTPPEIGVGVRGHPVLSDGVVYTVGGFGYVAFGVPEHGYIEAHLFVPGDEGTEDAHFAFADAIIQELGWTS